MVGKMPGGEDNSPPKDSGWQSSKDTPDVKQFIKKLKKGTTTPSNEAKDKGKQSESAAQMPREP